MKSKVSTNWGQRIFKCSICILLLTSQPYVADILLYPLEHRHERVPFNPEKSNAEYIFVPACYFATQGNISAISRWPHCSLQRLVKASQLSKELNIPILVTGGNFLHDPNINYAEQARELLRTLSVNDEHIIVVPHGANTQSEVSAIKRFIRDKNVVLVTSATHLERATTLLLQYCNEVYSAPVDFHSSGSLTPFLERPSVNAIFRIERAIYEYGARLKYWLINI
ncbi:YdcF family protein [Alteromonas sp. P256]|uniref:YdcF family protein n=1 Tax=Alteromonas sp. P256 TaxID=3117399 RepID=UPI002FDFC847